MVCSTDDMMHRARCVIVVIVERGDDLCQGLSAVCSIVYMKAPKACGAFGADISVLYC